MNALAKNQINADDNTLSNVLKLARTVTLGHSNDLTMQYVVATLAIAAVTYGCFLGGGLIGQDDAIMLYFATTYLLAYRSTLGPALWASILSIVCFDYFITPPIFQFELSHAFTFSIMLFLILLTSHSTAQIRKYATGLEDMVAERTRELANTNRRLSEEVEKHKITEDKLRRTVEELGRSNAMLQQFARIASHDLQEPLRVIQGYVGLLNSRYESSLDIKGREFLDFIKDGTIRMERLVKGILEHASISYNTKRFEIVDIGIALEDACANLEQRIKDVGAVVTHDQLPSMSTNRSQITQLFQNLIGNALKFQKADCVPRIHISCIEENTDYIFTVADNGIGIEPQYQEQIFGMFKRLHSTQQYPGSGLGLAICKAIVDQHSGSIWVESELGQGSKFCFRIPNHKLQVTR